MIWWFFNIFMPRVCFTFLYLWKNSQTFEITRAHPFQILNSYDFLVYRKIKIEVLLQTSEVHVEGLKCYLKLVWASLALVQSNLHSPTPLATKRISTFILPHKSFASIPEKLDSSVVWILTSFVASFELITILNFLLACNIL